MLTLAVWIGGSVCCISRNDMAAAAAQKQAALPRQGEVAWNAMDKVVRLFRLQTSEVCLAGWSDY